MQPNQISAICDLIDQKPQIVQCIQACNEEDLIEACILQVYNKVDRILVIEGAVKNKVIAGQATPDGHSLDRTVEIIKDVKKNKDPDRKIIFIQLDRPWNDLEEMKNAFFQYMQEGDWMLITDADEFIKPETVDLLRQSISLEPYATEFVPTFYHLWRDYKHIRNPESTTNWGTQHQRFIKFQPGLHYRTHPVATDANGQCTYFSPHYLARRFVLPKFDIFHYSYMNFRSDAILGKKNFYNKELNQSKHGGSVGAYERGGQVDEFVNYSEPQNEVLTFDLDHPKVIQDQPWFYQLDEKMSTTPYKHYRDAQPYSMDNPQLIWAWRNKKGYDRLFNILK